MDDLQKALEASVPGFMGRAVCRELVAMMLTAKPAGSIALNVPSLASAWCLDETTIWQSIDALCEYGFWEIQHGVAEARLVCVVAAKTASKTAKANRTKTSASLKEGASIRKLEEMSLSSAKTSLTADIMEIIPQSDRKAFLDAGYKGSIPCENFSVSGVVFKPDNFLVKSLGDKFPNVDIGSAFSAIFSELKHSPKRPKVLSAGHWISAWIEKNQSIIFKSVSDDDLLKRLNDKEDY